MEQDLTSDDNRPPDTASLDTRQLATAVYIPTMLFSVGQGALIPVLPLLAQSLGASTAVAGLMVGASGLGQLLFALPAGGAVSAWGDRRVLVSGAAVVTIAAVGGALAPSLAVLAVVLVVMGAGSAYWELARFALVSEGAPMRQRGRALSSIGGMNRIGLFIGPTIGAAIASTVGLGAAFLVHAVAAGIATYVALAWLKRPPPSAPADGARLPRRLARAASENRRALVRAGPPIVILGMLRQSRHVFLPLWGAAIGLDVVEIGFITTLSFLFDAALFYPVGSVIDRYGRKFVSVPCLALLGLSYLVLPLSHDFATFALVGMLSGLGNGLGAGLVLTLGADLAPRTNRGEFLGVWRLISESGHVAGPVVSSVATGLAGLAAAAGVVGGIGLAGAAMLATLVSETRRPSAPATDPPGG